MYIYACVGVQVYACMCCICLWVYLRMWLYTHVTIYIRNYTREINGMNLINHARYCIGIKIFAGEEMVSPLGMFNIYLIKYTYSGGQMEMKIGSIHGNWLELTCHSIS